MNWKSPPQDSARKWLNKSLEIQLMLLCSWRCCSCDAYSQFPSISWIKRGTMTLAQIEHFVRELKDANGYFGRIRLLGGEPSIHPKFAEMVELLHSELVPDHVFRLEVITNGAHPEKIDPIRHLVKVRVSGAADKEKHHVANMRATPASLGYKGRRCSSPEHCGWSLSYYGYAPCSAGAGIMRLRDLMGQHQRTSLPESVESWDVQQLCDHCYHGLRSEDKVKTGASRHDLNTPSPDVYEHLGPWLSGKQPDWQVYGAA